ncbi:2'-5' RNA ligase family protein [Actinoplanes sp. CA-030573]|uniref:2'-5' RNA ligase family protein n=1 Tax=Actinoplanes sp. CA-030573 TaxID=3239898 RepID=UPI003D943946
MSAILSRVPVGGPFSLHLAGGGRFGSAAWAAVRGDISYLSRFRENIRSALDAGGFPSDPRPYQPHLTVTYRVSPAVLSALDRYIGLSWTVDRFALVESANGAYTTLQTWPL